MTVPPGAEALDEVHALVERFWREQSPGSDTDRTVLELALLEIAGNVVRHGAGEPYTVTLHRADDRVVAEIDEPGRPLPADIVETCAMPGEDAEGGRGLALARAAVDELTYEHRDGVNHWSIARITARPA